MSLSMLSMSLSPLVGLQDMGNMVPTPSGWVGIKYDNTQEALGTLAASWLSM